MEAAGAQLSRRRLPWRGVQTGGGPLPGGDQPVSSGVWDTGNQARGSQSQDAGSGKPLPRPWSDQVESDHGL